MDREVGEPARLVVFFAGGLAARVPAVVEGEGGDGGTNDACPTLVLLFILFVAGVWLLIVLVEALPQRDVCSRSSCRAS